MSQQYALLPHGSDFLWRSRGPSASDGSVGFDKKVAEGILMRRILFIWGRLSLMVSIHGLE